MANFFSMIADIFKALWEWIKDNLLLVLFIIIVALCFIFPVAAAAVWTWLAESALGAWVGGVVEGLTTTELLTGAVIAWAVADPEGFGETIGTVVSGVAAGAAAGLGFPSFTAMFLMGLGAYVIYKVVTNKSEDGENNAIDRPGNNGIATISEDRYV